MRASLTVLATAALLAVVDPVIIPAQRHEIPQLNSCIHEFYDPEMYKWLTFKNTCTEALTVVYISKDGSVPGGTMDLRAGAKDSVGRQNGKVPKLGSFDLYVCPLNNLPYDESNKVVSKPNSTFQCRQKADQ